jgi:hypothetical protein
MVVDLEKGKRNRERRGDRRCVCVASRDENGSDITHMVFVFIFMSRFGSNTDSIKMPDKI